MLRYHTRNDEALLQRRDTLTRDTASNLLQSCETRWNKECHQSQTRCVVSERSKMIREKDCHFSQNSRVLLYLQLWAETSFLQQGPHITLSLLNHIPLPYLLLNMIHVSFQQHRGDLHPLTDRTEDKKKSYPLWDFTHRQPDDDTLFPSN